MIQIDEKSMNTMIQDAASAFPHECCGFFFGGKGQVTEVMVISNKRTENKERRFLMDPLDFLKAEEYAEDQQLDLMGIYHSHPNHPSIPSEFDRVHAWPNLSYIIISVLQGQFDNIQSWRLNEDRQFEEEIISPIKTHTHA